MNVSVGKILSAELDSFVNASNQNELKLDLIPITFSVPRKTDQNKLKLDLIPTTFSVPTKTGQNELKLDLKPITLSVPRNKLEFNISVAGTRKLHRRQTYAEVTQLPFISLKLQRNISDAVPKKISDVVSKKKKKEEAYQAPKSQPIMDESLKIISAPTPMPTHKTYGSKFHYVRRRVSFKTIQHPDPLFINKADLAIDESHKPRQIKLNRDSSTQFIEVISDRDQDSESSK